MTTLDALWLLVSILFVVACLTLAYALGSEVRDRWDDETRSFE